MSDKIDELKDRDSKKKNSLTPRKLDNWCAPKNEFVKSSQAD